MSKFPDNRRFAFSIFDDTDLSTVENVSPVYRLLEELGMRTTKSVWPLASTVDGLFSGSSIQEPEYLQFVLSLKRAGFEIALHNVRNSASTREEVEQGLAEFHRLLGHFPRVHANHAANRENLYWGAARFSTLAPVYRVIKSFYERWPFEGHVEGSKYFWGDICRVRIDYVRNLVFREINLERVNPSMPYYDPQRPFVKAWFSSSDGGDANAFCDLMQPENQDRLEEEGGVCIVYTHFACGFVRKGNVHPEVRALLRRLSKKRGWAVPVSTLLDYLHLRRGTLEISPDEIARMERSWLSERIATAAIRTFRKFVPQSIPVGELSDAATGE
jgi:hypothetical protein